MTDPLKLARDALASCNSNDGDDPWYDAEKVRAAIAAIDAASTHPADVSNPGAAIDAMPAKAPQPMQDAPVVRGVGYASDLVWATIDAQQAAPVGAPTYAELGHVTIEQARAALDDMDDYARMRVSVDAMGPRRTLEKFITQAETATPPAVQAPLTDEQIDALWKAPMSADWEHREFARAIESAHGIGAAAQGGG